MARALKALGQPVIATGVAGGPTGTRIIEHLTEEGILNDFVRIREESRTSTAVVDPTSGEQTEINERGPHVSEAELELFVDKLLYLAKGAAVCVFAGSLPRGVDAGLYARLVEEMRRLGVTTVLDSEGEPLRLATRARARTWSARTSSRPRSWSATSSPTRTIAAARLGEMVELGAREAIMTLSDGCLALLGDGADRRAVPGHARAARAGVVGGLGRRLPGRLRGRPLRRPRPEDCLRFAVACGAESTQHFGAGRARPAGGRAAASPRCALEALGTPAVFREVGLEPAASVGRSSAVEPRIRHGSRDRPGQEGPPRIRLR